MENNYIKICLKFRQQLNIPTCMRNKKEKINKSRWPGNEGVDIGNEKCRPL